MNVLLRKNKFRPSTLLIAALLIILTIAVPGSRGTTSPSTGSYAELIGTVNVAALPAPTVDNTLQTVALPLLLPDATALQTAKTSARGASSSTTSPNPSNNFIHVQKQIAGTPGTNPNPCRCAPPDQGLGASDKFVVNRVNLAVSATADPTGTWYIYRVVANQSLDVMGNVVCDTACQHTLPDQPY